MTQKGRVGSRATAPTQSTTYAGAIVAAGSREVFDNAPTSAAQQPGGYPTPGPAANAPQRPATAAGAALALPAPLLQARRWLLWCWGETRHDGKRAKVPWYVQGGRRQGPLDTPEDTAQLATYAEAQAKLDQPLSAYVGLGFALGDGWQGIDLDRVSQNNLADLANELPGYVELSPSGKGCHAIGYGRAFRNLSPNGGIEAYCSGRFFTFTATPIRLGPLCCLADYVEQRLVIRHRGAPADATPSERMPDQPQRRTDDEVMRSFWYARNAEHFRMLWHGEGLHRYGNDHSAADQALMTQLAFYTENDGQLVRLFHMSALGQRDKAWRQDYIDRTVARARATHAPKLAAIAAAQAAMAPAIEAALAARRAKGGAR